MIAFVRGTAVDMTRELSLLLSRGMDEIYDGYGSFADSYGEK